MRLDTKLERVQAEISALQWQISRDIIEADRIIGLLVEQKYLLDNLLRYAKELKRGFE